MTKRYNSNIRVKRTQLGHLYNWKGVVEMGNSGKKDKGKKEQKKKAKLTIKEKRKQKHEKHDKSDKKTHVVISN